MRQAIVALSAVAFALGAFATIDTASAARAPKMTKMGCMVGKQKWDAGVGKCMDNPHAMHHMTHHMMKAKPKAK